MGERRLIAVTVSAVALIVIGSASAKPGKVVLPAGGDAVAFDVATQRDGRVVIAGSSEGNGLVWRLKENGKLDRDFADEGVATIDSGGNERLFAVAIQPDGKIVVAGSTSVDGSAAVYRLRRNGQPDTSFDTDGALGIDSGGFEELGDIAFRGNGKIVVCGGTTANGGEAVIYQVKKNGGNGLINDGLDDSFAGDGALGLDAGGGEIAYALALQKDGKVVVVGATSVDHDGVVWRVKADGSGLDGGFGNGGLVRLGRPSPDEFALGVALQPDRKILVAGSTAGGSGGRGLVWRLRRGGKLDRGFAGDGERPITLGNSRAEDVEVLGTGGILVAGSTAAGATVDGFVAKLTSRGRFDRRFKGRGKRVVKGPDNEIVQGLDVDRDKRILIAGWTDDTGKAFVNRLRKNGATDRRFNR